MTSTCPRSLGPAISVLCLAENGELDFTCPSHKRRLLLRGEIADEGTDYSLFVEKNVKKKKSERIELVPPSQDKTLHRPPVMSQLPTDFGVGPLNGTAVGRFRHLDDPVAMHGDHGEFRSAP